VNLRRQLLLVSLLLLSLPWAGCQFIREMEGALRQGQMQSLQATAQAVAAVLEQQVELIYPYPARRDAPADSRPSIYAQSIGQPLIVDGYADGWEEISATSLGNPAQTDATALSYRAATRGDMLYLLLEVRDADVIYHNPGRSREPNGDRVILRTWQHDNRQEYVIATAAPGSVRAIPSRRRLPGVQAERIHGFWQDAVGGYSLELEIPLAYTGGRLGFYVANVGRAEGSAVETLGNITALETTAPPWLIYSPVKLQETLASFDRQGKRILVLDQQRWLIGDLNPGNQGINRDTETFWLLQLLYRGILSEKRDPGPLPAAPTPGKAQGGEIEAALAGNAGSLRYSDPRYRARTTLSSAAPIRNDGRVMGAVVVRQSTEQYLSLTDQAFSRLLGYSLLALGIGIAALLGYASLLSWRIGRLSRAARNVVRDDGVLLDNFPRSDAPDEIGALSRRYADLLDNLRSHQQYLRTLSRKLSHELRTPIVVVQTSLENLEQVPQGSTEQAIYITRAREGLARLGNILTAMSEASRLEDSIRNNKLETHDLVTLLREVFDAYRLVYSRHALSFTCEPERALARVAPDLLVQALDKLMDNAATFCPDGGRIDVTLAGAGQEWALDVSNEGPPLPEEEHHRLFEPMVTLREETSADIHLGLGLHIVRLIADYCGGRVTASDLPDRTGVSFTLFLPAVD
jgi:dedicated sortase system histidine kinase